MPVAFVARTVLGPNTVAQEGRFIVDPGLPVDSVVAQLDREDRIERPGSLLRYLSWRGWTESGTLKAGRYLIPDGLDNRSLARLLMSGSKEAVQRRNSPADDGGGPGGRRGDLRWPSIRQTRARLPTPSGRSIGHGRGGLRTRFIPNTYEVWYDLSAADFVGRMSEGMGALVDGGSPVKAESIGLSPTEVGILASIVKAETSKMDEAPTVAGLYLNRLDRGMRLQADPTLIHALAIPPYAGCSTCTGKSTAPTTPTCTPGCLLAPSISRNRPISSRAGRRTARLHLHVRSGRFQWLPRLCQDQPGTRAQRAPLPQGPRPARRIPVTEQNGLLRCNFAGR